MNEVEENEEQVGDSTTTPVIEINDPSPTSREEPTQHAGPIQNKTQIVLDSLDVISSYLKNINEQKHYLASMGYMVHSLQKLLEISREHEGRLNAFLVNDEKLQTRWLLEYLDVLPPYGDYTLVLNDVPDLHSVDQIPGPVKEAALKEIAEDAMHNMYAGGMQVKAQRSLDMKLNSKLDLLREVSDKEAFPFSPWMMLLAKEIGHEDTLENKFFEVSAFLDFLNHSSSIDESG